MDKENLVAACGLYCGVCTFYRAYHDGNQSRLDNLHQRLSAKRQLSPEDLYCDGCLSHGRILPYCRECKMKTCASSKPGVTRCSDCNEFPCEIITAFNNDGMRHHAEAISNLQGIRRMGLSAWLKEYEERWRCPQCRKLVEWYAKTCFHCGAPQPDRLPSVPEGRSF